MDIRGSNRGPAYAGLEEAKADVVGMFGLKLLADHGAVPKERLEEYYASYVAGIFRTLRFGTGEAHGRAEMMEFSYLIEQHALNLSAGKYKKSTFGRFRAWSPGSQNNCWKWKPPGIGREWKPGSQNTTACRLELKATLATTGDTIG